MPYGRDHWQTVSMVPIADDTSLPDIDPMKASPARVYDFWLGGSHHRAVDRDLGRYIAGLVPRVPAAVWANRKFLRRVVRYLVAERGITQFLDLGSGVLTVGNVHEVALADNADARTVYVDIDPVAVEYARTLLADTPSAKAVHADLRHPERVLTDPLVTQTLDLSRPVAVLMFAVLHFIPGDADVASIAHHYMGAVAPGSFLALSHGVSIGRPDVQDRASRAYQERTGIPYVARTPRQVEPWLSGLEVLSPGVVPVNAWWPRPERSASLESPLLGAVARKPGRLLR